MCFGRDADHLLSQGLDPATAHMLVATDPGHQPTAAAVAPVVLLSIVHDTELTSSGSVKPNLFYNINIYAT